MLALLHVLVSSAISMSAPSVDIPKLIADLKNDTTEENATKAVPKLIELGDEAIPALTAALTSTDLQQRQCAGYILCRIEERKIAQSPNLPPPLQCTPELLTVIEEALKSDSLPCESSDPKGEFHTPVFNASSAVAFLARRPAECQRLTSKGLKSADPQQRFLSAVAAAFSHPLGNVDDVVGALVPHLRHNDIAFDASIASRALFELGPRITPTLDAALRSSRDDQQRAILKVLIHEFALPPSTDADRVERDASKRVGEVMIGDACQMDLSPYESELERAFAVHARSEAHPDASK